MNNIIIMNNKSSSNNHTTIACDDGTASSSSSSSCLSLFSLRNYADTLVRSGSTIMEWNKSMSLVCNNNDSRNEQKQQRHCTSPTTAATELLSMSSVSSKVLNHHRRRQQHKPRNHRRFPSLKQRAHALLSKKRSNTGTNNNPLQPNILLDSTTETTTSDDDTTITCNRSTRKNSQQEQQRYHYLGQFNFSVEHEEDDDDNQTIKTAQSECSTVYALRRFKEQSQYLKKPHHLQHHDTMTTNNNRNNDNDEQEEEERQPSSNIETSSSSIDEEDPHTTEYIVFNHNSSNEDQSYNSFGEKTKIAAMASSPKSVLDISYEEMIQQQPYLQRTNCNDYSSQILHDGSIKNIFAFHVDDDDSSFNNNVLRLEHNSSLSHRINNNNRHCCVDRIQIIKSSKRRRNNKKQNTSTVQEDEKGTNNITNKHNNNSNDMLLQDEHRMRKIVNAIRTVSTLQYLQLINFYHPTNDYKYINQLLYGHSTLQTFHVQLLLHDDMDINTTANTTTNGKIIDKQTLLLLSSIKTLKEVIIELPSTINDISKFSIATLLQSESLEKLSIIVNNNDNNNNNKSLQENQNKIKDNTDICMFTNTQMMEFALALEKKRTNCKLKYLDLQPQMSFFAFKVLAYSLRNNQQVETFNVSCIGNNENTLKEANLSVMEISKVLSLNSTLKHLTNYYANTVYIDTNISNHILNIIETQNTTIETLTFFNEEQKQKQHSTDYSYLLSYSQSFNMYDDYLTRKDYALNQNIKQKQEPSSFFTKTKANNSNTRRNTFTEMMDAWTTTSGVEEDDYNTGRSTTSDYTSTSTSTGYPNSNNNHDYDSVGCSGLPDFSNYVNQLQTKVTNFFRI